MIDQQEILRKTREVYSLPLLELVFEAAKVHKEHFGQYKMKCNHLISFKTGGCGQDCAYCAQSARYPSEQNKLEYINEEKILELAENAKEQGVTRVCISASWGKVPNDDYFDTIISAGKKIRESGLEVCCTIGTSDAEQIKKLRTAGFIAYNHNIDTSRNFYPQIITTRTFEDRIQMLNTLIDNDMNYCSGGIIGLGESEDDRIEMIAALASMKKQPYTFPINAIVPVKGTPMEHQVAPHAFEVLRMIATARIMMPKTNVCLAAGRADMSYEAQALCFLAGANSIFMGEKLLTTQNHTPDCDKELIELLGLAMI